ncbi:MAG: hypothetical protein ACRDNB_02050 [Gaiellaceae bacterium]
MVEQVTPLEGLPIWRRVLGWLWWLVPRFIRRYLAARFRDVTRSEASGYAVWTAMGFAIGIPEIWAAIAGDDFYWPTISTTVGHLQDRWPVLALIPVAMIVMAGYSVFRVERTTPTLQAGREVDPSTGAATTFQALGRTPEGRLAKQDVPFERIAAGQTLELSGRQTWHVLPYFFAATAAIVVTALIASRSDNRFLVGYVLYSLIAIVWVAVPNLAAYFFKKDVPFTTIVFTVRCLGRRLQLVAAFVAALLVILMLHLAFYPWPSAG